MQHIRVEEVPIQRTDDIDLPYNRSLKNWVIVGIVAHTDPRHRQRGIDNIRKTLQLLDEYPYVLGFQSMVYMEARVIQDTHQFRQDKRRSDQAMSWRCREKIRQFVRGTSRAAAGTDQDVRVDQYTHYAAQ